jgi:hypothetical protein
MTPQQSGAYALFPCCPLDDEQPCPQAVDGGHDLPCEGPRCKPSRVDYRTADLQRRIDRTLDYTDALLRLPDLNSDLVIVLQAVHNSLCTPAAKGEREAWCSACDWRCSGTPEQVAEGSVAHGRRHGHAVTETRWTTSDAAGEPS